MNDFYTYTDLSLRARVIFEPRDLWVGVYWTADKTMPWKRHVYVCVVPMLPIVIEWNPRLRL